MGMADLARNKTHLVLVNAVVEKDGKVLASQRSFEETHQPGKWTVPGGKVERAKVGIWDILEKTAKDEVMEETGIEIMDDITLVANNSFIRSTGQHVVALTFLCHWKSGEAKPLEDTIDVKWITEKEIKSLDFAPNVDIYIQKALAKLKRN